MKITAKQKEKLDEHISKSASFNRPCPCGAEKFTISEHLGKISAIGDDRYGTPVVMMICDACGLIQHFSALTIGLVDKETFS